MTNDALIFIRLNGQPQSPLTLSKEWRKAADSIGLDGVSFHALRHTHANALIDANIDVVKISKRLGHASPTITLASMRICSTGARTKAPRRSMTPWRVCCPCDREKIAVVGKAWFCP
jgi:integrase